MIKAVIFDLDGTLIQTEVLKARSYAKAIHQLTKGKIQEEKVLDGFSSYVGLSRTEVVEGLSLEFMSELAPVYPGRKPEFISQAIISKRLEIYGDMINDSELLSGLFCPFNIALLNSLYEDKYIIALATMSYLTETERMLSVMKFRDKLSVIVTRDSVANGKPDPEIYLKVSGMLGVKPEECLVIEDSVNGINAAVRAGMTVFAVTNDITRESVHKAEVLENQYIIDDLAELKSRIYNFIAH